MGKPGYWKAGLTVLLLAAGCAKSSERDASQGSVIAAPPTHVEISRAELNDKIMGGFVAQLLGNLNGLPHEFKYFGEPGDVTGYTPGLPDGGRTDDDTDLEWVYISAMQQSGELFLPPDEIGRLWKAHVNCGIWCANAYARQLMELGIEPPLTGRVALNPWSEFNISGQFICESFGLICPGMPQAAAMIGTHYTHVTIDGEPAQATQLFTAMIALAFFQSDIDSLLDGGLAAVDPLSEHVEIVNDVRAWHARHPGNWRTTRELIKEKYARYGQRDGHETRDGNAYELNSASVVAALLYGKCDLSETLRLAFNFGWDADCNAATAATIVGVIRGWDWIKSQGWQFSDSYRNTTRDGMPEDETISSYGSRIFDVAGRAILQYGGSEIQTADGPGYRIKLQRPSNVEPLPAPLNRGEELQARLLPQAEQWLGGTTEEKARGAYVAIALGDADRLKAESRGRWNGALAALKKYPALLTLLFNAPSPCGDELRRRAVAAGLSAPGGKS